MKTTHVLAALVVLAGFTQISEAGLFNKYFNKGSAKCCDCVPTCQPECCQPVIVKPCRDCNAYCYQRPSFHTQTPLLQWHRQWVSGCLLPRQQWLL